MKKVLSLILAGGKGGRMDVLCQQRAKPILYFAGKLRVIDFSMSNCIHSGIKNVGIITDYDRYNMTDYLMQWGSSNNLSKYISILGPGIKSYCGTADAVYQNLDFIKKSGAEIVLILAGDHIYKMDYRKIIEFHHENNADVTLGTVTVPLEQASRFGTIVKDSQGRLTNFEEKSITPQSNLVSMGIYVFNRDVLEQQLILDASSDTSLHDFGYSLLPKMVKQSRVFAYKFNNYWRDIGTIDAYYDTNLEYIRYQQQLGLNGNWPVLTAEQPQQKIGESLQNRVENSIISAGCTIQGRVENSVLSPGVYVDEKAIVRNSIILPNTYVGYHSIVENCILEEDTTIGEFCYIGVGASNNNDTKCLVLDRGIKIPSNTAILQNGKMTLHNWEKQFRTKSCPWGVIFSRAPQLNTPDASIESMVMI